MDDVQYETNFGSSSFNDELNSGDIQQSAPNQASFKNYNDGGLQNADQSRYGNKHLLSSFEISQQLQSQNETTGKIKTSKKVSPHQNKTKLLMTAILSLIESVCCNPVAIDNLIKQYNLPEYGPAFIRSKIDDWKTKRKTGNAGVPDEIAILAYLQAFHPNENRRGTRRGQQCDGPSDPTFKSRFSKNINVLYLIHQKSMSANSQTPFPDVQRMPEPMHAETNPTYGNMQQGAVCEEWNPNWQIFASGQQAPYQSQPWRDEQIQMAGYGDEHFESTTELAASNWAPNSFSIVSPRSSNAFSISY